MVFVHYGALAVAAPARADFEQALRYLRRDPVERGLFERLERGPQPVRLLTNRHDRDDYDPNTHTIHWDPHSALRTTHGGHQSPALGLGHEVDHAVEDARHGSPLAGIADRRYDTLEERRVIRGSECHAARTLGESVRYDHGGTCYRVAGPTIMPLGFAAGESSGALTG